MHAQPAYPATIRRRSMRLALNRRPTAADRIRAAVARLALRVAAAAAPRPSAPLGADLWNG